MNLQFKPNSIGRFILLWMAALVTCFVVLAADLILSTNLLQQMTTRILIDSGAVELSHRIENAVLNERREDFLWRTLGEQRFQDDKREFLGFISGLVSDLEKHTSSEEEITLIAMIGRDFRLYREATTAEPPLPLSEVSARTDSLLARMEQYREQNNAQMLNTLSRSVSLNDRVDRWALILILLMGITIVVGALVLAQRILRPTAEVIRAARSFGEGSFDNRARVFRQDELGMLSRTINEMAASIRNLQQERLNFVASVAHDLKNPLVTVGAAARLLRKGRLNPLDQAEWLDRIIERVDFTEQMIQDLMISFQAESGKLELELTEFDPDSLLREIYQRQRAVLESHVLVLEAQPGSRVKGDPRRLERVIANLINNAVKYSPAGTTIRISLKWSEKGVLISVDDQGAGIAEQDIPHLFQPFKRLADGKSAAPGHGLGLYSAGRIVDLHGGTIAIRSKPRQGTSVEITLPLSQSSSTGESTQK